VFLDEFQEMVAIEALDDYLRSFRKFGCSVYLATQHLDLPAELRASIFANCSRFFAFASSAADATALGKEFGGAEGALVAERLPELKTGQAYVKVRGETVRLLRVDPPGPLSRPEQVDAGRARCLSLGAAREQIEQEIDRRRQLSRLQDGRRNGEHPATAGDTSGLPEGYADY
jgi:hypothetical protein